VSVKVKRSAAGGGRRLLVSSVNQTTSGVRPRLAPPPRIRKKREFRVAKRRENTSVATKPTKSECKYPLDRSLAHSLGHGPPNSPLSLSFRRVDDDNRKRVRPSVRRWSVHPSVVISQQRKVESGIYSFSFIQSFIRSHSTASSATCGRAGERLPMRWWWRRPLLDRITIIIIILFTFTLYFILPIHSFRHHSTTSTHGPAFQPADRAIQSSQPATDRSHPRPSDRSTGQHSLPPSHHTTHTHSTFANNSDYSMFGWGTKWSAGSNNK